MTKIGKNVHYVSQNFQQLLSHHQKYAFIFPDQLNIYEFILSINVFK